ncbi:hypothetical protein Avbf_05282 [Armadillidium vulgare]|nr:hypothetical protein Avbf_05282 [Armadillidium vulgare]
MTIALLYACLLKVTPKRTIPVSRRKVGLLILKGEAVASQPPSPVLSCANTTITIIKESPVSDKEACIKKDDDSVFCTDYDNLQASINLDVPSSASVNSGDSSQSLVNSTFSVLNPENITTTHSPKITGTYSPKLTGTHSPRERVTTLQPIQNNVFKKPMGITSSKFSFSKLPNFSSGKPQTSLSLKRSTSTSVLNSGGVGNSCGKSQIATSSGGNKENVLKKSTSFVQKNGSTSALKNKENKGVKTVAFGSSYSGTPRMKLSSKRSLTYSQLPNVTTEQSKK